MPEHVRVLMSERRKDSVFDGAADGEAAGVAEAEEAQEAVWRGADGVWIRRRGWGAAGVLASEILQFQCV